jgi:esterase/lipase superfamily enzyme
VIGARTTVVLVLFMALLAGCAQRGSIVFDPEAANFGAVQSVFVASSRAPGLSAQDNPRERSADLSYGRFDISVPPNRLAGTVSMPQESAPNPKTQFLVVSQQWYDDAAGFRRAVNGAITADASRSDEAVVFVHGFNTNLAEGLYRQAQMKQDFGWSGLSIQYSWPSAGNVTAYAFDRESALFARDGLERLLDELTKSEVSRIILVGHSMGAQVVMETLRQMAIRGSPSFQRKLESVVLVAPDVDVDLFHSQFRSFGGASPPVYVFVSGRDRALLLSSLLRGRRDRLGSIVDGSGIEDLPVTMIDVTEIEGNADRLGHFTPATSPSMIAMISGMSAFGIEMFKDEADQPRLFDTTIDVLQNVTTVVLTPLAR